MGHSMIVNLKDQNHSENFFMIGPRVEHQSLKSGPLSVSSSLFIPKTLKFSFSVIMTHGYTTCREQLVMPAMRLCQAGIPVFIFDLPGHFASSLNDLNSFEDFKNFTPHLFHIALKEIEKTKIETDHFVFGGHSLGGLLSLLAPGHKRLISRFAIGVGAYPKGEHPYQHSFFREMIELRSQMVSRFISPQVIFDWLSEEKEKLLISNEKIQIINGEDDFIATEKATMRMKNLLEAKGNTVDLQRPKTLPHHRPDLIGPHLFKYLKKL